MGSASSKDAAAAASSSSTGGGVRKGRSRVFHSSCFGLAFALSDDHLKEEESGMSKGNARADEAQSKSDEGGRGHCRKLGLSQPSKLPSLTSSDGEQSGQYQDEASQVATGASSNSSTIADIGQSSNTSGRSRSRFSFISDGVSFRLNRAVSLGSSGAHSLLSAGLSVPNGDQGEHGIPDIDSSLDNRHDTQVSTTAEASTSQDVARNNARIEATVNRHSHRDLLEHDRIEVRHPRRRVGPQEHLEGSMRFSRTRSVGRLRDRVLRRTPFSEGLFGSAFLEDRSLGSFAQANVRRVLGGVRRATSSSSRGNELLPDYSSDNSYQISNSMERNDSHALETPQSREATNRDILEHRSAFLERRRRIRSQVRALQRLGSRFENLSGHDRSCILSGQHRTGRCTCRTSNGAANTEDDTSTRASISRIVMLAEALFEVLDEIHQQSVVLSSRPSFSSIGSVPAPKEVVECMPMKSFMKPQKHQNEEAAQCYICLVEYEDGDCMRILPCNHEFHRTCIDKWLKEIHRVCPLCRGDVCRSDASSTEKLS